ncbi:small guanosine triphosphatase family Ras family protein (macronuclear) [Tetrahymena thermophila SB210]|uniref:Small guanosine triphosphatase family Ras family protein n=2 Tax=Tetrahymena thermophila TaxID=5911 RepID=I7MGC6_TETTS|nr:small guanosine triphosphatase family Ras family protein [Tetrahymena thermophila SB210]EAS01333.1 small guanosine triphosphatase family Ras family protein [Tetrahymena thermophila SB210]BAJ21301.1 Rab-family small GTPase RabX10 [Tetrahymena thermophila]|eukprot:XP_001021578.1 small guanosine triphosphatase family Ras family protein [Tetrahymena thermophila SB210]
MKVKDQMFKVLILGDPAVGKSCLLLQYCDQTFQPTHVATVGIDFKMKVLQIQDSTVKMQLWDTAGQERYQTLASTLYKGAMGIVLVYSVDNRKAFDGIARWVKQIKENTNESIQIILVANKSDLPNKQVSTADGRRLAEQYQLDFFEVSAMTGENVKNAFETLANKIYAHMKQNPPPVAQEQETGKKLTVAQATTTTPSKQKGCACG